MWQYHNKLSSRDLVLESIRGNKYFFLLYRLISVLKKRPSGFRNQAFLANDVNKNARINTAIIQSKCYTTG